MRSEGFVIQLCVAKGSQGVTSLVHMQLFDDTDGLAAACHHIATNLVQQ